MTGNQVLTLNEGHTVAKNGRGIKTGQDSSYSCDDESFTSLVTNETSNVDVSIPVEFV